MSNLIFEFSFTVEGGYYWNMDDIWDIIKDYAEDQDLTLNGGYFNQQEEKENKEDE